MVSSGGGIDITPGGVRVGEVNDWGIEGENINFDGYGYEYFNGLIDQDDGDPTLSDGKPSGGIYKISGDQTINDPWTISSGETLIILIGSDLTIQRNVVVNEGGFLALIVNGDVEIEGVVTDLQGVYIVDGDIITSGENDTPLSAEGMFFGLGEVSLNRKFVTEALNDTLPVETFVYRPDLLMSAPDTLKRSRYTWQEVAP